MKKIPYKNPVLGPYRARLGHFPLSDRAQIWYTGALGSRLPSQPKKSRIQKVKYGRLGGYPQNGPKSPKTGAPPGTPFGLTNFKISIFSCISGPNNPKVSKRGQRHFEFFIRQNLPDKSPRKKKNFLVQNFRSQTSQGGSKPHKK